jgi:hypothetical protein
MSESGEKDVFEAMVDKVLAYRPKKAKRKKRRVKSAKKAHQKKE